MLSVKHVFSMIGLLILQVLICNRINFLGFINPYIYIAFVFYYPLHKNRFYFLSLCFLLGLFVDIFSDSGGVHASALLTAGYLRLFFVRVIFKKVASDYPLFKLKSESITDVLLYTILLTTIHHFFLFLLANFSLTNLNIVLVNTFSSLLFTSILIVLGSLIFKKGD